MMTTKTLFCSGLPHIAYLDDAESPNLVLAMHAGEPGLYPILPGDSLHGTPAKALNEWLGLTKAQVASMVTGAGWGWHVKGACVHGGTCSVVENGAEDYSVDRLDWVMVGLRTLLDLDRYEVIASGESEVGIGGREIPPDPEVGIFIRTIREDRADLSDDEYSIRVRNVGREDGSKRWFLIEVMGDSTEYQTLDFRVNLNSSDDAIDGEVKHAFEMLDRWNRGEV